MVGAQSRRGPSWKGSWGSDTSLDPTEGVGSRLTLVLASPVGFTRPGGDRGPVSQGHLLPWGPRVTVLGRGAAVLAAHPRSVHLQKTVSARLTMLHSP